MDSNGAHATYERGRDVHRSAASRLEARERGIGGARLAVAVAALGLAGGMIWGHLPWAHWALTALGVAFVALVLVHARATRARQRALARARFHTRGLARLALSWPDLPTSSERFRSSDHPFTGDLDIFGRASLMQAVDATETRFGEERLASLLSLEHPSGWPDETLARAAAARELAGRTAFREALATAACLIADERPDPSPLIAWAEGMGPKLPWALRGLSWALPCFVLIIVMSGPRLGLSAGSSATVVLLAVAAGLLSSLPVSAMLSSVSSREPGATRWREALACIESHAFDSPLLSALRARLTKDGRRASQEMAALERIVGFVDARRNEVFRFFIGPLLMWDLHCAVALLRWRKRCGPRLRGWMDSIGEAEALASLGAFAYEHPDYAWPELAPGPLVEARGLGHPCIPRERRVGNDVALPGPGRALVVTGSNMSGKSTLLRALGVNAVLALAGAPVCARSMRIGPLGVATSMRVEDSLAGGISHFYAELIRLKQVVDRARAPGAGAVFFLLDEILHGTNSRERVLGALAVVRDLLAQGALGCVSTHDLGITILERDLGGLVENVHFEEQVNGRSMTFDYVLRPGVVQSSNALRLMRAVGLDVPEDGDGSGARS